MKGNLKIKNILLRVYNLQKIKILHLQKVSQPFTKIEQDLKVENKNKRIYLFKEVINNKVIYILIILINRIISNMKLQIK